MMDAEEVDRMLSGSGLDPIELLPSEVDELRDYIAELRAPCTCCVEEDEYPCRNGCKCKELLP